MIVRVAVDARTGLNFTTTLQASPTASAVPALQVDAAAIVKFLEPFSVTALIVRGVTLSVPRFFTVTDFVANRAALPKFSVPGSDSRLGGASLPWMTQLDVLAPPAVMVAAGPPTPTVAGCAVTALPRYPAGGFVATSQSPMWARGFVAILRKYGLEP